MKKFDVIVIGAGPAGYAAAMRAVDFKKKVALIEKDKLGGAGIHNGALWSKTLWEISTTASMLRTQGSGLNVHDLDFQMDQIYDEVNTALDGRVNQLQHHMDQINIALEGDFFEYIEGSAKVVSKNGVAVESEGTTQELAADYIILATGSRPRKLSHLSIDEEIVMTSDGLPKMNKFPKSIVILGAGVIGCEFATIFSGFGQKGWVGRSLLEFGTNCFQNRPKQKQNKTVSLPPPPLPPTLPPPPPPTLPPSPPPFPSLLSCSTHPPDLPSRPTLPTSLPD